jgi:hypothetical protein
MLSEVEAGTTFPQMYPASAYQLVKRIPHHPCTVAVKGMTDPESGIDFDGLYTKDETSLGEFYVRGDNQTRLHYVRGDADGPQRRPSCDDWFLERNNGNSTTVTLYNCTDAPPQLVRHWLTEYRGVQEPGPLLPCQTGADQGRCNRDEIYSS